MSLFDEKVEVDLGEGTKPVAQTELEEAKKEPQEEFVDVKGHDLWMLFAVGIFVLGAFSFYLVQNLDPVPVSDLNALTEQHTTLALLELTDANVLFNELQTIKSGLVNLQVQHLCGVNLLLEDSNQLVENEQGVFVTYQCYAKIGDAT